MNNNGEKQMQLKSTLNWEYDDDFKTRFIAKL